MTEFEVKACKFLGIILSIIIVVIVLQLTGCVCEPPPPSDYIDEIKMENYARSNKLFKRT